MATEKLSIELEAKVGKYKTDLLEAQKSLLKLENEALKAGGANKKMAAQIALAKNQVKLARNEYNLSTIALKQYAVQTLKTGNAVTKLGKKQKQSNMAMTQAAYAIDDMQYGFQGVQNNIQAMAVSLGASGGLVIGLTIAIVAIGVLAKKFQQARKEAKALQTALAEKQGLMATMLRHAEVVERADKGTVAYKDSLKALKDKGYDPLTDTIPKYISLLKEQMLIEAKLEANKGAIQDALKKRLDAENKIKDLTAKGMTRDKAYKTKGKGLYTGGVNEADYRNAKKAIADTTAELNKLISLGADLQIELGNVKVTDKNKGKNKDGTGKEDGAAYSHAFLGGMKANLVGADVYSDLLNNIKDNLAVMKAAGADNGVLLKAELEQLNAIDQTTIKLKEKADLMHKIEVIGLQIANLPPLFDNFVGLDKGTSALNKFKTDLAAVRDMLDGGVISFDEYINRVDNLTAAFNKVNEAQGSMIDIGGMLTGQIANLISGFAEAAGSGDNMGNALLKGLGNMLVQLGGLIIAAGVAALKLVITLTNPAMAPFAIAAGAALVAAGAAVSSFANKAAGGGGGSSSSGGGGGGSTSVVRPNPNRQGVKNRDSNLIIPMERLRYGLQGANDNYSGFN